MKPEDALPKGIPEAPEPSKEEFHRAALELQSDPEHVAITAIKSGIVGLALAAGILAAPPGYAQVTLPTPISVTETVKEIPFALEVSPTGREGDPPDPSMRPSLPPVLTRPSLGARIYDAGQALSGIHADLFGPAVSPARQWIIADEPQNRTFAPSGVVSAELPDWSTPLAMLGSAAQHGPGQLLEEPLDVLLVLRSDLQHLSSTPPATEITRTEAKGYITELWADLVEKLIDPQTAADKIADELFKLPEHLLLLVGGAVMARLGFKKKGGPDSGAKPPSGADSEMVAGFVAVKVFSAGLERRNGVLLQTGRALRRVNKLLASEVRNIFAYPAPDGKGFKFIRTETPAPAQGFSVVDIRAYLNLLAGSYTTDQVEATLAVGFYKRVDQRWRFADIEKPGKSTQR